MRRKRHWSARRRNGGDCYCCDFVVEDRGRMRREGTRPSCEIAVSAGDDLGADVGWRWRRWKSSLDVREIRGAIVVVVVARIKSKEIRHYWYQYCGLSRAMRRENVATAKRWVDETRTRRWMRKTPRGQLRRH